MFLIILDVSKIYLVRISLMALEKFNSAWRESGAGVQKRKRALKKA
jgi:hypothetical protein